MGESRRDVILSRLPTLPSVNGRTFVDPSLTETPEPSDSVGPPRRRERETKVSLDGTGSPSEFRPTVDRLLAPYVELEGLTCAREDPSGVPESFGGFV